VPTLQKRLGIPADGGRDGNLIVYFKSQGRERCIEGALIHAEFGDKMPRTPMKKTDDKTAISPFDRFTKVMDGLMTVPHSDLKRLLDREKKQKARKKRARTSRASHASGDSR